MDWRLGDSEVKCIYYLKNHEANTIPLWRGQGEEREILRI
jgi:hypothetical protein